METFEYQGRKIHRWQVGASTYLVHPQAGARLMSWFAEMADGSIRDIIYWPEEADFDNIGQVRGGNPILFPFCGRCHAEGEVGKWQDSTNRLLPMPQHGFARTSEFEIQDANEVSLRTKLIPDKTAKDSYPYDYEFLVSYFFGELGFQVELGLRNHGNLPIPWSPGHHFYFALPWHDELQRENYQIHIPAKRALRHLQSGEFEPEVLEKGKSVYGMEDPSLINRIHTNLTMPECTFGPKNGEEQVAVRFKEAEPIQSARTIVTWTDSDEPYYCVEPWMGPPNSPAHRSGLQYINPGESSSFTVEVSLT